jgi:hypothetical protein
MRGRLKESLRTTDFAETQRPSPQPSPRKSGERERGRSAVATFHFFTRVHTCFWQNTSRQPSTSSLSAPAGTIEPR